MRIDKKKMQQVANQIKKATLAFETLRDTVIFLAESIAAFNEELEEANEEIERLGYQILEMGEYDE